VGVGNINTNNNINSTISISIRKQYETSIEETEILDIC